MLIGIGGSCGLTLFGVTGAPELNSGAPNMLSFSFVANGTSWRAGSSWFVEPQASQPELAAPVATPSLCVVPATLQILLNTTCASLGPLASSTVDLAGMAEEREHVQLLLRMPASAPPATLSTVHSTMPVSVLQVGYVNTSTTTRYSPSGGGWRPDPLLELDPQGTLLEPAVTTPLWLSFTMPATSTNGTLVLEIGAAAQQRMSVELSLTVWEGLKLPPPLDLHRDFGEIWSWDVGDVETLYGRDFTNATASAFRQMNTAALLPPDNLYKRAPYDDPAIYAYLRESGAYLLNLAALGSDPRGCPTPYTDEELKEKLATIEAAVGAIGDHPDVRPYVYGYDEQPPSCEPNIRRLFGAVKARWPHVTTAAVLNWPGGLPADLPVDIWIVQYEDWNATQATAWQATPGKQLFGYHCIEPSGGAYLNTFIERPRTQGRLLYWLAVLRALDGWLYYATDIWRPRPGSRHAPLRRIGRSPRTDFDPSNYIWSPRTDIFANGDGQFVYPGLAADDGKTPAPIASARLLLQRDAVEDAYLLRLARRTLGAKRTAALIERVVHSPTDHTDEPMLLEATRREAAAALVDALQRARRP